MGAGATSARRKPTSRLLVVPKSPPHGSSHSQESTVVASSEPSLQMWHHRGNSVHQVSLKFDWTKHSISLTDRNGKLEALDMDSLTKLTVGVRTGDNRLVPYSLRLKFGHTALSLQSSNCIEFLAALHAIRISLLSVIRPRGDAIRLHQLFASGQYEAAKRLLQDAATDRSSSMQQILAQRDGMGNTPLHIAAWAGDSRGVRTLLRAGADIDAINLNGETPLMLACARGHESVIATLLRKAPESALSTRAAGGLHALHFAALHAQPRVIDALLVHGVSACVVDTAGRSALHMLCSIGSESTSSAAQSIVARGKQVLHALRADSDATTAVDAKALDTKDYHARRRQCAGLLVDAAVEVVDLWDTAGRAPLHMAVERRDHHMVRFLLQCGATVYARDSGGLAPSALIADQDEATAASLEAYSDSVGLQPPLEEADVALHLAEMRDGAVSVAQAGRSSTADPFMPSASKSLAATSQTRADAGGATGDRTGIETSEKRIMSVWDAFFRNALGGGDFDLEDDGDDTESRYNVATTGDASSMSRSKAPVVRRLSRRFSRTSRSAGRATDEAGWAFDNGGGATAHTAAYDADTSAEYGQWAASGSVGGGGGGGSGTEYYWDEAEGAWYGYNSYTGDMWWYTEGEEHDHAAGTYGGHDEQYRLAGDSGQGVGWTMGGMGGGTGGGTVCIAGEEWPTYTWLYDEGSGRWYWLDAEGGIIWE